MFEFTVFTPAYNRANTLQRLFDSLKIQTFSDFEWLIIDDGSTDNTEELVYSFIKGEHKFSIRYYKVENGGKHRAVNKAVRMAEGRLFFIVDSDDYLPPDSLSDILHVEQSIPDDEKQHFAGVSGQRYNPDDTIIGSTFSGEICDCTYLESQKNNIYGDKAEVYYTDILKKYPFPEFDNEKFIMESVVWNVIAADGYKLRYFNKNVYYCEYQPQGLTDLGASKYKSTPRGYGLFLSQQIKYGRLTKLNKWKTLFDYYRMFSDSMSAFQMAKNLNMNPIYFSNRMLGIRIFYKLYNR